jgi:hypothetical protein
MIPSRFISSIIALADPSTMGHPFTRNAGGEQTETGDPALVPWFSWSFVSGMSVVPFVF